MIGIGVHNKLSDPGPDPNAIQYSFTMHSHLITPLSSRILSKCLQQITYLRYCTTVCKCYMHLFVFPFI